MWGVGSLSLFHLSIDAAKLLAGSEWLFRKTHGKLAALPSRDSTSYTKIGYSLPTPMSFDMRRPQAEISVYATDGIDPFGC